MVVVTKVDLVDPSLSTVLDPSEIGDSDEVKELCGRVSQKTGFAINQIIPLKCYHNEDVRSFAVEMMAIEALAKTIQHVFLCAYLSNLSISLLHISHTTMVYVIGATVYG